MSAPRKIWVDIVGESTWMHVNGSQKYADDVLYHHDDVVRELRDILEAAKDQLEFMAAEDDDAGKMARHPLRMVRTAIAKIAQEG